MRVSKFNPILAGNCCVRPQHSSAIVAYENRAFRSSSCGGRAQLRGDQAGRGISSVGSCREPAAPRADLWNGRANERRGWPIFVLKAIFRHCARLVLMRRQIESIIAHVSDKRRTACGRVDRTQAHTDLRQCFALCTALRRLRSVCTLQLHVPLSIRRRGGCLLGQITLANDIRPHTDSKRQ